MFEGVVKNIETKYREDLPYMLNISVPYDSTKLTGWHVTALAGNAASLHRLGPLARAAPSNPTDDARNVRDTFGVNPGVD